MAKRSAPSQPNDSDRIEGFAHPRETFALLGQDVALGRAARALRAGRPPSAWLITGAPGVGKATLAYRIARYLLAFGATLVRQPRLLLPSLVAALGGLWLFVFIHQPPYLFYPNITLASAITNGPTETVALVATAVFGLILLPFGVWLYREALRG